MGRFDDGKIFMVNPDTRKITISVKYSSVVGDNGSQILTFGIQRYIDGYDIMDCNDVAIHYNIISEEDGNILYSDVYQCDDLRISETDENVILVSWKLSKNATKFNGILSFTIKYSTTYVDEEDQVKEIYALQSRICEKLRIFTRVNNSQQVVEEYGDVLQQWKEDLEKSKPTVNVSKDENVTTISITDKDGTTTATILDGVDGKSAYELAVENGFEGTEEEWLESLKYYNSEEFAQLTQQVKQDAQTASTKAQEAMTAATNADKYAKDAQASKEKANESALSAIEAANNAGTSASSAADSANTAKTNADKTNQDKIEVSNLVSGFDDHVTEKTTEFNQNVTEKTNAFDIKVVEANSTIDEKVTEATNQAEKAKNEADRATQVTDGKLDKNQGVENVGKVMVVNEEGNLVPGESLPKNIYTKEEVNDLLYDKMDKPYKSITITDDTTIEDCLDGRFKINKILGNTYQAEESDIVPTPIRQIPINSRKVKVDEEYVELRSLKDTGNIWDLKPFTDINGTYYQSNDIEANCWGKQLVTGLTNILKPDTTYSARVTVEMVEKVADEGFTQNYIHKRIYLFRQQTDDLSQISTSIIDCQTELNNGDTTTVTNTFTTPADLTNVNILFYTERYTDVENTAKYSTVKFKDITLVEGSTIPQTYISPTVRDYKIVDHITQTAKIVRNVNQFELPTDFSWNYTDYYPTIIGDVISEDKKGVWDTRRYNLSNYTIEQYFTYSNNSGTYLGFSECDTYWELNNSEEVNAFLTRIKEDGKPFLFQYQLATPVEEPITYVETDTSEVGYSWQDMTSPSPTIKSEVQGVDEIDILKTGKNLFDVEKAKQIDNWTESIKQGDYIDFMIKVIKGKQYTFSYRDELDIGLDFHTGIVNSSDITNDLITNWAYHNTLSNLINNRITFIAKDNYISLRVSIYGFNQMFENLQDIQLELGETATAYEPYTEQHVNIMLPQPMYQGDVANVESGEYEYDNIIYVLDDKTPKTIYLGTTKEKTQVFQLKFSDVFNNNDIWCDKLKNDSNKDEELFTYNTSHLYIAIDKNRLETVNVAGFKKWLKDNPLTFVGSSSTPTKEVIPEEDLAKLKSLKTNAGVNNIFVGGEVNPTIEAYYPQDIVSAFNKIQTKILTLQEEVVKNV